MSCDVMSCVHVCMQCMYVMYNELGVCNVCVHACMYVCMYVCIVMDACEHILMSCNVMECNVMYCHVMSCDVT